MVSLYQEWLYTGRIVSKPARSLSPSEDVKEYERLVKCFILGEKLLDGTFKDCVVDAIVSLLFTTDVFDPTLTNLIYENTPWTSPLRKLWQDIYIYSAAQRFGSTTAMDFTSTLFWS